nr:putative cytochrome C oxidase subunit 5B-like [Ipomoea batatas]
MWRRLSIQLLRSTPTLSRFAAASSSPSTAVLRPSVASLSRYFNAVAENVSKKRVEDVMPIATGHEREELQAELEGRQILDIDFPEGPFGTKEAPAIVKSYYDKRIVGCPGGEGEDEHDVVWFWLEKGKPHECPVCTQYFALDVVGPGGPPDGHGDHEDDHHH